MTSQAPTDRIVCSIEPDPRASVGAGYKWSVEMSGPKGPSSVSGWECSYRRARRRVRKAALRWAHLGRTSSMTFGQAPTGQGEPAKRGRMAGKTKPRCTCSVPGHGTRCEVAHEIMGKLKGRAAEKREWIQGARP